MKVLQNQYYIMKIPSDKILDLKEYSFKQASLDGNIVSIGDNLVLEKIRNYYGINIGHVDLYNKVQRIRKNMKDIRKEPSSKSNINKLKEYQNELNSLLFVDDIINIKVFSKKQYAKIARNGFDLNGKHYIRFMVGAGQMRRNTVTFVNEKLYNYLYETLMCGLAGNIKTINLAKLSAYFALSFSSVLWVREPRVCVIKDFYTTVKNQKVNFLEEDKDKKTKLHIIEKDFELNSADGQGLIDPEFAKLWAKDMALNYTPSSFVVRTTFIKGNLVPFDFKQYARNNNIKTITDRYGTTYNIEDIDVLLSESQFKMAKFYSSWEGYLSWHKMYGLKWGVARYNKEFDDEYVLTNYQYLQVLNLDEDDIKGLISYTKEWIQKICSGDKLYALLYNVGVSNTDNIDSIINACGSAFTKAIVKNPKLLQDKYVRAKIYSSIKESIRQAKLGRIWVKGNYQFMISDPIMQCRSALGLPMEGGIPANHVYSNFWHKRGKPTEVVCRRSPLTVASEIVPLKLFYDLEYDYWYQYIKSGIIYSVYDIATLRHADSDFD